MVQQNKQNESLRVHNGGFSYPGLQLLQVVATAEVVLACGGQSEHYQEARISSQRTHSMTAPCAATDHLCKPEGIFAISTRCYVCK